MVNKVWRLLSKFSKNSYLMPGWAPLVRCAGSVINLQSAVCLNHEPATGGIFQVSALAHIFFRTGPLIGQINGRASVGMRTNYRKLEKISAS